MSNYPQNKNIKIDTETIKANICIKCLAKWDRYILVWQTFCAMISCLLGCICLGLQRPLRMGKEGRGVEMGQEQEIHDRLPNKKK